MHSDGKVWFSLVHHLFCLNPKPDPQFSSGGLPEPELNPQFSSFWSSSGSEKGLNVNWTVNEDPKGHLLM
jgi:hypothetical protein